MYPSIALLALLAFLLLAEAQETCPATQTVIETKVINVTISSWDSYTSRSFRNVVETHVFDTTNFDTATEDSWAAASLVGDAQTTALDFTHFQDLDTGISPIERLAAGNNIVTSDRSVEAAMSARSDLDGNSSILPGVKDLVRRQNQSTLSCPDAVPFKHTLTRTMVRYLSTFAVVIATKNVSPITIGTLSTAAKNWTGAYIPITSSSSVASLGSESRIMPSTAHISSDMIDTSDSTTHDQTPAGQGMSMPIVDSTQAHSILDDLTSSTGTTPSLQPTTIVTSICKSWHGYNYTQLAVFTLPPSTTLLKTSFKPFDTAQAIYNLTLTDDRIDATYTFPLPNEATPCPAIALPVGWDLTCGEDHNNQVCPGMLCCGRSQLCGSSRDYCKRGCRKHYGLCWHDDDDHGPAVIGGFVGGAISGAFGSGCVGLCGLELPTPRDSTCSPYPAGCPPGKGGDDGDVGADTNDGNDENDNDQSQDHDRSTGNGGNDDGHGHDHNDSTDDCSDSNKHPVTFYHIHCVQYVSDSSNSLYDTCTRTDTSTSEVCATGSDFLATEWTTKHCSTTATATVTSIGCAQFTFMGTERSVTTTKSCTTATKEISGCEVIPSATTSYWTCSPTQTVTDYTCYCKHNSGNAGSKEVTCTETISRVVSGCSVEPTSTSIFSSCSFAIAVSPDDDYGMGSKCNKHITSTATDFEASCVVRFISSGAYTSTVSSCTATKTSRRTGACITATTTSHYTTFSACPMPNMTIKVISAGQQCARPQMTISPIEESSCPASTVNVDPDADQGQCGEDEGYCPYNPDVVLSPDDDQGEEGEDETTCPYNPSVTLSPNDDQGENGAQNVTSFSTANTNCLEACTGPISEGLGSCSLWQQDITSGSTTQGCECESPIAGSPWPEPVITCGNLKCPNELNINSGCITTTTGPCMNPRIPEIGPCTREKHIWLEDNILTSSDRCHCPLAVSKHMSATAICNLSVCPNEVEVVYRMSWHQWTVTRAAQVPTEDKSQCSPTNTALGDCLELDVLWLDSTITSCSCLLQQGREVWPILTCGKTVCPNQVGRTTFVPRYAPTFTQDGCSSVLSEGLAPCTKRIWSSWTSTWIPGKAKRGLPSAFRHGSYHEFEFTSTDCVCSWFWAADRRKLSAEPVCGTLMCPSQVAVKYGTSVAGLFSMFPSAHWSSTSAEPQVSQTLSFPSPTSFSLSSTSKAPLVAIDDNNHSTAVKQRGVRRAASPESGVEDSLTTSTVALDSAALQSTFNGGEDITTRQSLPSVVQTGQTSIKTTSTLPKQYIRHRGWVAKFGQWYWAHANR